MNDPSGSDLWHNSPMASVFDIPSFAIVCLGKPASDGCRALGYFPISFPEHIRRSLLEAAPLSDEPLSRAQLSYWLARHALHPASPICELHVESLFVSILDSESDRIRSVGDASSPILLCLWIPPTQAADRFLSAIASRFSLSAWEAPFSAGDIDEASSEYSLGLAYLEAAMLSSAPASAPASPRCGRPL